MRFRDIYSKDFDPPLAEKEAIVKAIAYFDMFDFPLTVLEIQKNLSIKSELSEVVKILDGKPKEIDSQNGFYFLAGRNRIIQERLDRYNATDRKFKKALRLARLYKFIPWIKMIAIGNLMGAHNLKEEGDIDFFVITENNRIWLSRFFCGIVAKALNLRPKPGDSRDKICLSFFISEAAMDLRPMMLRGDMATPISKGEDIYFIHWLGELTPIYDRDSTYEKLILANHWLKNHLPNWQSHSCVRHRIIKPLNAQFYLAVMDMLWGGLELWLKKIQLMILPKNLIEMMNQDTRVVINNEVIKLHTNDRREDYRQKYREKIRKIING
jgi:hypothetical protein